MSTLRIAATGHRPNKLYPGGVWDHPEAFERLVDLAMAYLRREVLSRGKTVEAISGMAQGWDMAWAVAALRLRNRESLPVRLICAVPYRSQPEAWNRSPKVQRLWQQIVDAADEVTYLAQNPRNKWEAGKLLNDRNLWMVQQADQLVALWNGDHPTTNGRKSGTGNCVMDAAEAGKPVRNLWGSWQRHAGL